MITNTSHTIGTVQNTEDSEYSGAFRFGPSQTSRSSSSHSPAPCFTFSSSDRQTQESAWPRSNEYEYSCSDHTNTNSRAMDYGLHLMPSSKLQMPSCPVPLVPPAPPVPPVPSVSRSDDEYTGYKHSTFGRCIPMPQCLRFPPHSPRDRPLPPVLPIRSVGGNRYRGFDNIVTPSFHVDLFNIEASCNVDHVVRSTLQSQDTTMQPVNDEPVPTATTTATAHMMRKPVPTINAINVVNDDHRTQDMHFHSRLEASCSVIASSMDMDQIPMSTICDPTGRVGVVSPVLGGDHVINTNTNTNMETTILPNSVPLSCPQQGTSHEMDPGTDYAMRNVNGGDSNCSRMRLENGERVNQNVKHTQSSEMDKVPHPHTPQMSFSATRQPVKVKPQSRFPLPSIDRVFPPSMTATTTTMSANTTITPPDSGRESMSTFSARCTPFPRQEQESSIGVSIGMRTQSLNDCDDRECAPSRSSMFPYVHSAHSLGDGTNGSGRSVPRSYSIEPPLHVGGATNINTDLNPNPPRSLPPAVAMTKSISQSSNSNAFGSPLINPLGGGPRSTDQHKPVIGSRHHDATTSTTTKQKEQRIPEMSLSASTGGVTGLSMDSNRASGPRLNAINLTSNQSGTTISGLTASGLNQRNSILRCMTANAVLAARRKKKKKRDDVPRPYRCSKCPKSFRNKAGLSNHKIIHNGLKPHKCKFAGCSKAFARSCDLTRHTRLHTGDKPFVCTFASCKKAFTRSVQLRLHVMDHTGYRPFHCTVCGKGFKTLQNSQIHMRIHTGERPYQCPHCKKRFTQSSSMKTHVSSMHRDLKCTEHSTLKQSRAKRGGKESKPTK